MTFRGTIQNGRVVLDEALSLPDGTARRGKGSAKRASTGRFMLSDLAQPLGIADLSAQHDHYASGAPRRKPARSAARKRK
jgi:hypothetical protein